MVRLREILRTLLQQMSKEVVLVPEWLYWLFRVTLYVLVATMIIFIIIGLSEFNLFPPQDVAPSIVAVVVADLLVYMILRGRERQLEQLMKDIHDGFERMATTNETLAKSISDLAQAIREDREKKD